jgi:hypothetical protein
MPTPAHGHGQQDGPSAAPTTPAEVLARLASELRALEVLRAEHLGRADAEGQAARACEWRVMAAIDSGRDGAARGALARYERHAAAAEDAAAEAAALEAAAGTYRNALAAVWAQTPAAAEAPPATS